MAKDLVETPDVNHLEKASATTSNHEANTQYTAEKAIDGKPDTRWALIKMLKNQPSNLHLKRQQ